MTRRLRILVAEDEPLLVRSLARALGPSWDLAGVGDGLAALRELASGERPDVVLCDLVMPRLGGRGVYAHVVARDPELASRFVFMTSGALDPEDAALLELARRPVLYKPFTTAELLSALRGGIAEVA